MRFLGDLPMRLVERGLDLLQPFDASSYNETIARLPNLRPLPLFGKEAAFALLVGNSRALWPQFLGAYRSREDLRANPHPLDRYVTDSVLGSLGSIASPWEVRFSHEQGERFVSMLHLAEASGLAAIGPARLAIHPTHGPWFGLRAVIVFDEAPPEREASSKSPCEGCPAPCLDALSEAMRASSGKGEADPVPPRWEKWVAVRDACPHGVESRYSEAQLRYHYAKDRTALEMDANGAGPRRP